MSQNSRAESRHQTYNVEVWNPSFNAELNEPNRLNGLGRWRATRSIADLTPQAAIGFFPAGTPLAALIDVNDAVRRNEGQALLALNEGAASASEAATQGPSDVAMHSTTQ